MNYIIGALLGISISSFYWYFKFKTIQDEIYIEYAKRCKKWEKLSQMINKGEKND